MLVRRVFKVGSAVVLALPKAYREALKIYPGTDVVLSVKDRTIFVSRAVITSAAMQSPHAAGDDASGPTED